jgi:hypothetical protein
MAITVLGLKSLTYKTCVTELPIKEFCLSAIARLSGRHFFIRCDSLVTVILWFAGGFVVC